jgi:hypothetical protein
MSDCLRCLATIPSVRLTHSSGGFTKFCSRDCQRLAKRQRSVARQREARGHDKPCRHCGIVFAPRPCNQNRSKFCSSLCRQRHSATTGRTKDSYLRITFNMTLDEWNAIFDSQGRTCACCKATHPGHRTRTPSQQGAWHTDHDHKTGAIRGILCHSCNTGLGRFQDSEERLSQALAYLRRHKASSIGAS